MNYMTELQLYFRDGLKAKIAMNAGDMPLGVLGELVYKSFLEGEIRMNHDDGIITRSVADLARLVLVRNDDSYSVDFGGDPQ